MNILVKHSSRCLAVSRPRWVTQAKIFSLSPRFLFANGSNPKPPQDERQDYNREGQAANQASKPNDVPFDESTVPPELREFVKEGRQEVKDPKKLGEAENEYEDETSFVNESKKGRYLFIVAAVGLIGGYFTMQINTMREEKTTKKVKVSYSGKADIGGPWTLYDVEGREISDKDLRGYYYLIYFGFCNCPDICPTSLHKLSKALDIIRTLPESKYIKLKTIFVSVDPDRDKPETIKKFLALFDKSIIGVTGRSNNDPLLKETMKKFRIYASKIEMDENQKSGKRAYTLDHTIITYLMDDSNNYLIHLGSNLSDRDIASIVIDSVMQNERNKAFNKF